MHRKIATMAGMIILLICTKPFAFEVTIQGKKLLTKEEGETCIDISGDYPGIQVIASTAGKTPQICFNDAKHDILSIHNVTFVATGDPNEVAIEFKHDFPPGPNGYVMARAKLNGFFASPTGLGVPTGDKIQFTGFFSQAGQEDPIAETFDHTVGDNVESALVEKRGKKRYLIAGPRTLIGRLQFSFVEPGHKLTLPAGTTVSIDLGSRFEDKLEEMDVELPALPGEEDAGESSGGEGEADDDEFSF